LYGIHGIVDGALTRRQHEVLEAARALERRRGYTPSVREIARDLDLSAATVQEHLVALERKGYVRRTGSAYGLQLLAPEAKVEEREESLLVPVRGTIAAGRPIEALEEHEEAVPVPRSFIRGECYFLRVRGDSMRDDAILDGDLVLVRRQESVANGEIAVALLPDGTATLKRVYRERRRFRLQPANDEHKPIFVNTLTVQGKVVSVLRTFG
jgi:repressor LexA